LRYSISISGTAVELGASSTSLAMFSTFFLVMLVSSGQGLPSGASGSVPSFIHSSAKSGSSKCGPSSRQSPRMVPGSLSFSVRTKTSASTVLSE